MSTAQPSLQVAAPGTPGSEPTPIAPSTKSIIGDAFKKTDAAPPPPKTDVPPPKVDAPPPKTAEAPPPKIDTPPPQEFPEDKLEIPANASPDAVKNFKAYKDSMKAILAQERQRVIEAENKLKVHVTAAPADTAEIQAKEARLKAAEDRLAIVDLQNHPDFTRQFVEPKTKALATASEVLAYNNKEGVELASLLGKPMKDFNAAVSEFTKDMNTADAATVAMALREARTLHASEQSALAKSGELRSQLQAKSAQEQKRAFETVATEITSTLKKMEITDTMDAAEKQSAAAYNQRLDTMRASAEKRAFGVVSSADVARMAFESEQVTLFREHVIPGLERRFASQNQVIAELRTQLEAVKGARSPENLSPDSKGGEGKPATTRELVGAAFKGRL